MESGFSSRVDWLGLDRPVRRSDHDDVAIGITKPDLLVLGQWVVQWTIEHCCCFRLHSFDGVREVVGPKPQDRSIATGLQFLVTPRVRAREHLNDEAAEPIHPPNSGAARTLVRRVHWSNRARFDTTARRPQRRRR